MTNFEPGQAAEDVAEADLIERAKGYPIGDDAHTTRWRERRFPWCDTCKRPSVFNELLGSCHSTAKYPRGVPPHRDKGDHKVAHYEWFVAQ